MKISKKFLSVICVVVALCMLLPTVTLAANDKTSQEAADALNKLGLFRGTGSGYELEKSLTRAEAVTMIVRLLGEEENAVQTRPAHSFTDVPDWANPYVGYAFAHNITKGVSETKFDSESKVTLQQFLTFVLRVLEYKDGEGDFAWDSPEALAMDVGLISSINLSEFLRGDMVKICLNALKASYKNTTLPMYKMLVERNIFTSSQYKDAVGINKSNGGFSAGGSGGSSIGSGGGSATIVTPSVPVTPTTPEVEEDQTTPTDPDVSEKPDTSDDTVNPDVPVVPDVPTTPENPDTPDVPSDSEETVTPPVVEEPEEIYTIVLGKMDSVSNKDENCFKIDATLSEDGKQLMVSLSLAGKVNISGFDMILNYNPKHFKLNNLDDAFDLQVYSAHNEHLGVITFNYVGIKNITESKEILTAVFDLIGTEQTEDKILLQAVEMVKIDDKNFNDILNVDYKLSSVEYKIKKQ